MKMQRSLSVFFVTVLALVIGGCTTPQSGPRAAHVIVLGVDGLSPAGVQKATTPHFNRVMREGAFTFKARGVFGTSSSQNWASMIMGAGPEQHGITNNGWERNNRAIQPTVTGLEGDIFPTIFGLVHEQIPNAKVASIYDWGGFGRLYEKSAVDIDQNPEGPEETMAAAIEVIKEELPVFTFIHLDHVDGALHGQGHGSDPYFDAVELTDKLLGDLLSVLDERNAWQNTVLIISSDHGGIGTRHGGESMDELEIPWFVMGTGVKPGKQIVDPVDTYDTAATAAFALGLARPYAWIARPVLSAFNGFADHLTADLSPFVSAPRLRPSSGLIKEGGLPFSATVDQAGAVVRYTTDGSEPTVNSPLLEEKLVLTEPVLVKTKAFSPAGGSSVVSAGEFLSEANGVIYTYYEGDWSAIPDYTKLRPAGRKSIAQIDLTAVDKRADYYSVHFESNLQIDAAGVYTFQLISDDGSKLWVNDALLIDTDGGGGSKTKEAAIDLPVGRHKIAVAYLETYGDNHLNLTYAGPGIEMQHIPARALFE